MSLKEIIRLALQSLSTNKLRSFLTMLGITIGVFSVIGVMTATGALQGTVENGLSVLGSNIFQFTKYPPIQRGGAKNAMKYMNRRDITYEEASRYAQQMQEHYHVPVCFKVWHFNQYVSYQKLRTNPNFQICGTNLHFLTANGFNLNGGRNLTEDDVRFHRNVAVVGAAVVEQLFPTESPLGKEIKIAGKNFNIVGILEAKGSSLGQNQDAVVLVPITRFMSDHGHAHRSVSIATQACSQAQYAQTMDAAIGAMRLARNLKPGDENDFEIFSNDSLVGAFASIANVIRMGAFVISSIALLAAGVGIMNIMLVSVTERTKEIGIRKSLGARRRDILKQFLIEALVLSEVGGLTGILLGIGGGNVFAAWMKASVVFPWGWACAGLLVCSLIGVGFGMYPAWRAAALDPIEALRFE